MFTKKFVVIFVVSLILTLSLFFISAVARADDPDTEPPTAPANLVTTDVTKNSVSVSWDASTDNVGVTGYNVYNGETLVDTVTLTSYTFSNLSPGTQYTFGVEAKDAAENVSTRTTINCYTLLAEPTNVAVVRHTTAIDISWSAVESAETYEVKVNEDVVSDITGTSYTYRGLMPGGSYSVQVRGMNANTSGTWSTAVNGTTYTSTTVSGTISQDTTWSYDNSPYLVSSTVTIQENITLTITQGTVIKFNRSSSAPFVVSGTLDAQGTTENPIAFTSTTDPAYGGSGTTVYWYGINLASTGTMNADHIKIRYAGAYYSSSYSTRDLLTVNGTLSLNNSEITNTYGNYAILVDTTSKDFTLNNTAVHFNSTSNSGYGIKFSRYDGGTITSQGSTIINDNTSGYQIIILIDRFKPTIIDGLSGYNKVQLNYNSSGTITQNLTLPQNYYEVYSTLIVSSEVTLDLDPGTVLKFSRGSTATVVVSGTLNANGTAENPIVFTSTTDPAYGGSGTTVYWYGINLASTGTMDADYIKIRYAGAYYSSSYSTRDLLTVNGTLSLNNSEITNTYGYYAINVDTSSKDFTMNNTAIHFNGTLSSGYGIKFSQYDGGTITSQGSTIINDGTLGYQIYLLIDTFKPTTVIGLCGYEKAYIRYSSTTSISQDLTLPQNYYEVFSYITIPSGLTLTLEPGTVFRLNRINGSPFIVSGTLNATGTEENPIVFTSISDPNYGGSGTTYYWPGIDINATGEIDADYIRLYYAGANYSSGYSARYPINDIGKLSMSNSVINNSYGNYGAININTASSMDVSLINNIIHFNGSSGLHAGIYFTQYNGGTLTAQNNTITNDGTLGYQICLLIDTFKPTTVIGLNGYEKVNIRYSSSTSISQDLTLPQNYYEVFSAITIPSGLTLNICPGTVFRLPRRNGSPLIISGILNAIGTEENPIVFTSVSDPNYGGSGTTYYWPGIDINATGEMNADYIRLFYAGADYSSSSYYARYPINNSGKLSISNSVINSSYGNYSAININTATSMDISLINNIIHFNGTSSFNAGIYFTQYNGGALTALNNTIINDGTQGYEMTILIDKFKPTAINGLSGYNKVQLNYYSSSTVTQNLTLPQNRYEVYLPITIPSGVTLGLDPGAVLVFKASDSASINLSGTLNANGTSEAPVVFTSTSDILYGGSGTTVYWYGININSTGVMNADYTKIRYAGASYYTSYSARYALTDTGTLSMSNSEITNTYGYGISVNTSAKDLSLNNNSIHFNGNGTSGYGIRFDQFNGGTLTTIGNTIINDGTQGYHEYIDLRYFNPTQPSSGIEEVGTVHLNVGTDYVMQDDLALPKNIYRFETRLVIPAGKTLSFAPGSVIQIPHYYSETSQTFVINGTLNAIGTVEQPITFTSTTDPQYGGDGSSSWHGFEITATGELNADYVKIRYAGKGASSYGAINSRGILNITNSEITNSPYIGVRIIDSPSSVTIENSTIDTSEGQSILIATTGSSNISINNNVMANGSGLYITQYPGGIIELNNNIISVAPPNTCAAYIDLSHFRPDEFYGLENVGIVELWNGLNSTLQTSLSLPKNIYKFSNKLTIPSGKTLSFAPGSIIASLGNTYIMEGDPWGRYAHSFIIDGTLNAIGTYEEPIIFTNTYEVGWHTTIGEWNGFQINSTGEMNADYTRIRFACKNGVAIDDFGQLSITNSEIAYGLYSGDDGILVDSFNYPTIRYNSFSYLTYGVTNANAFDPYHPLDPYMTVDASYCYWGINNYFTGRVQEGSGVSVSPRLGLELVYKHQYGKSGTYGPSGAFSRSYTDLTVSNSLQTTAFSRTYNSSDDRTDTCFGRGWTFNFEGEIADCETKIKTEIGEEKTISIPSEKTVRASNGAVYVFSVNADGTFTSKDTKSIKLVKNVDNTYTLTARDQTKYNYNSSGKLASIIDKYGNDFTINYSFGKIVSIVDCVGNVFSFTYNEDDKVSEIEDESENRVVTYEYEDGKLVRAIDPTGAITRYSYDSDGFLDEVKDHDNNLIDSVTYDHSEGDDKDKIIGTTDAYGNAVSYDYDNENKIVTMTDSNNRVTRQWYDDKLYIIKVQDPEGGYKITTYNLTSDDVNTYGEIASVTDRNGNVTSYVWDANGNNTRITNPDSGVKCFTYDDKNNLTSIEDENDKMTYLVYDATKVYLIKKAQPLNGTTVYDGTNDSLFAITGYEYYSEAERITLGYEVKGLLKTETDPEGGATAYTYDSNGNYAAKTNALNKTTSYTYNAIGWLTEEVSPKGYHTNYTYNKNGVQIKKVMDGGETYRTSYNREGRVVKDILPNLYDSNDDNITTDTYSGDCGTRYTYYANGKVMTLTDAEGNATSYTYDDYGNVETETRPDGAIFRYEYDGLDRITKKYYKEDAGSAEILLEEYTYTILVNKQTRTTIKKYTDGSNYVTEKSTYDYAERLVATENPDSTTTATVYNANGTVQITTDTNGKSTRYSYDGLNRLAEKWVPFELNGADIYYTYTSYTYDKCGRKLEEKYGKALVLLNNQPAQFVTTSYEYYADGNLETMTTSAGTKTEYAYDNDGVMSHEKKYYDASSYYQTDYTNNYWGKPVTKEAHVRKGDIFGYDFSNDDDHVLTTGYTYDDNGNLATETNPNNVTTTYAYDNLNRQTGVSQPGIDEYRNGVTITTSKDYDYAGNVVSVTDANNNETAFEYNGLGYQISMTDAGNGVTLKRYDYLGRMTAIVSPMNYLAGHTLAEMNRTEYTHDPMGRVKTMSQAYYDTVASEWKSYVSGAYKYDNNGNVIKELSGLGYAAGTGSIDEKIDSGYGTVSTYNYANLKLTALDPVSSDRSLPFTMEYAYDALGRKVAEINANGNITNYHYDDIGNITSVGVQEDSLSNEQVIKSMTYDKLGNVLTTTDGNGNTTASAYNALGKVRTVTYPSDATIDEYAVSAQYNGVGNQVYTFDNIYTEKFMTYDNQGRQLSFTEQKNDDTQIIATSAAYDKNGNKRFETNGNGDVKENGYDALNRLESSTITVSGLEQTTSYTYDADSNLLTTTDWRGNVTTNEYDPLNRVIAKKDANNVYIERLTYNINDAQVSSTDALSNVTSYTYDKNNRLLTTTDSGDDVTGKTYDNVGNIETTYDGENNTTHYDYDEFNRLVTVTDPESNETSFTYDLSGNLLTQTDGSGHVKTLEYNAVNKLIRSIDHGGRTGDPGNYVYDPTKIVSYAYYKNGLVHTMTDRNGEVTTYAYDCHDRMFLKNINSVTISYTYDNVGNQLTVTDTTGTTTRTYDELNRVLTKAVPVIGTTEYTYDITDGLPAGYAGEEYTDPASNTVLKVYDKTGRLYTVTDGADVTTYAYYDNGARQSVTYGNGAKEEYSYLEGKLISGLINRRPDNSIMDQYAYTYDDAHNISTKYEIINGTTKGATNYTYDTLNRLLTVTEPSGRVTTYTYDDAGNRETETIVVGADTTVKTYAYNSQNRLENIEEALNSVTQNEYDYTYDNNGNQTVLTRTPYDNGIPQTPVVEITNSYNDFNELTETIKGGITSTYTYNGEGLRVAKNVDSTVTRYLYEYSNIILETDNIGNETARNVYGINLLIREVDSEAYYYFYNGHADVTALMDTVTDAIDASYYYDAFGNILESTGSVSNSIRYAGYQYDEETGYYYLNARMYDPITARFLQEDTYTGDPNDPLSLNLYTYVKNNPLIYTDPTGHRAIKGDDINTEHWYTSKAKIEEELEKYQEREYKKNIGKKKAVKRPSNNQPSAVDKDIDAISGADPGIFMPVLGNEQFGGIIGNPPTDQKISPAPYVFPPWFGSSTGYADPDNYEVSTSSGILGQGSTENTLAYMRGLSKYTPVSLIPLTLEDSSNEWRFSERTYNISAEDRNKVSVVKTEDAITSVVDTVKGIRDIIGYIGSGMEYADSSAVTNDIFYDYGKELIGFDFSGIKHGVADFLTPKVSRTKSGEEIQDITKREITFSKYIPDATGGYATYSYKFTFEYKPGSVWYHIEMNDDVLYDNYK